MSDDDDDDDEFNGGDVRDLNNNIVNSDKENPSAPPLPTSMPFGEVNHRVPSPPPNYSRLLNAPNSSTNKVQFRQSNVRNPINTVNTRESLILLRSYLSALLCCFIKILILTKTSKSTYKMS